MIAGAEFIDANVLLRYLTGEPPEMADRARKIIEDGAEPLYISEVAFAEVAWTLDRRKLDFIREQLVDQFLRLFRSTRLQLAGFPPEMVARALLLCRPSRAVSFGDALIWARIAMDAGKLFTFDRAFPTAGITVRHL